MEGLHIVSVEAFPREPISGPRIGAFINVFVTEPSEELALARAYVEIAEAGWTVESVESVNWVTRDDYAEDPTGVEYFDQASLDGVAIVVHTYRTD
jgi:hypothetical protein